ncbi:MAG TPA: hypothetical protein VJX16_29080 [Terriglobales bacterium]|nr:hypothetical protein [Terriglobales bacterium]
MKNTPLGAPAFAARHRQIALVSGPRQVGKTTTCRSMQNFSAPKFGYLRPLHEAGQSPYH